VTPEQERLAAAYLASDDPLRQSGFSGGRERWERLRRPVADAVAGSGSFLDIGCANGALLDDVVHWCGQRGVQVDPWGVDVSPELVELARRRLPRWADRLFVGDAADWSPPRRWDHVRTELVYVDEPARPAVIRRLLADVVAPGGRLLVCCDSPSGAASLPRADEVLLADLQAWGFPPTAVHVGGDVDGVIRTAVAVLPRAAPRTAAPRRSPHPSG
jgi:SAM-dependent methyltransferase